MRAQVEPDGVVGGADNFIGGALAAPPGIPKDSRRFVGGIWTEAGPAGWRIRPYEASENGASAHEKLELLAWRRAAESWCLAAARTWVEDALVRGTLLRARLAPLAVGVWTMQRCVGGDGGMSFSEAGAADAPAGRVPDLLRRLRICSGFAEQAETDRPCWSVGLSFRTTRIGPDGRVRDAFPSRHDRIHAETPSDAAAAALISAAAAAALTLNTKLVGVEDFRISLAETTRKMGESKFSAVEAAETRGFRRAVLERLRSLAEAAAAEAVS